MELYAQTPTHLWLELGRKFFSKDHAGIIDQHLGDRRHVSIGNVMTIKEWPKEWKGDALFELVGYSPKGYKMNVLRETYVNEEKWEEFKCLVKELGTKKGFSSIGMTFNMSLQRKGGCLSSMHLVRNRGTNIIFLHGKIAEVPRKFTGDLLLVRDLLSELQLWPMEVRFMYSIVYFSIIGLRSYVPVLGLKNVNMNGLPIMDPRNYQASIIEVINQKRKELEERYTKQMVNKEGVWKEIDLMKGTWKRSH